MGTGSGVLALAGLLRGLDSALALDNDPLALEAALTNARVNKLEEQIEIQDLALSDIEEHFPVITANLTGRILKEKIQGSCPPPDSRRQIDPVRDSH